MGWRDLIQDKDEEILAPWLGGRSLQLGPRVWRIEGHLANEHGWYWFTVSGRKARFQDRKNPMDAPFGNLLDSAKPGYLVGDHLVPDDVLVDPDPAKITEVGERVHLVEEGVARFSRIRTVRLYENGPLIYMGLGFPLGSEAEVLNAFLDREASIAHIKNVPPALEAAFRLESFSRDEVEKRRAELEKQRQEEERRRQLEEQLGNGAKRREMARLDFAAAAKAALAVGGADFLDHRKSNRRGEMVVTFRYNGRRFECTCDEQTLRIIDSGLCLENHGTGEKGDDRFTLESLPAVIQEAQRLRRLVVRRRADDYEDDDFNQDDPEEDWM